MNKIIAFLHGIIEFKISVTSHYEDYQLLFLYDKGRNFAHVVTFRKYEA